jgi:hypothetical protein
MNTNPNNDEMSPAMAFLVDKLKSGKANIGDLGVILADTYRQTDYQSKVLDEQTKSIKLLQDKVSEIEPAVNTLMKERNTAKWAIRGVVSFVSAFGIAVFGWVYTQGQSIAYALSLDEQTITSLTDDRVQETKLEIQHEMRVAEEKNRTWVEERFQRKP